MCRTGSGVTGRVGDQHVLFGSPRFAAEGLGARDSVLVQRAADHMLDSLGGTMSVFVQSHTALEDSASHPDADASSSHSSPSSGEHPPFSLPLPIALTVRLGNLPKAWHHLGQIFCRTGRNSFSLLNLCGSS